MRLARAQRLTGRATELGRAEARSAVRGRGVPGGSHVRPTRTTETGSRDDRPHTGATSFQTCLVFSAPRPRPSKSPGIHRKNSGPPPSDPGVRASAGLGGGGGSPERTRLAAMGPGKADGRIHVESEIDPPYLPTILHSSLIPDFHGRCDWRGSGDVVHPREGCVSRHPTYPA